MPGDQVTTSNLRHSAASASPPARHPVRGLRPHAGAAADAADAPGRDSRPLLDSTDDYAPAVPGAAGDAPRGGPGRGVVEGGRGQASAEERDLVCARIDAAV